MYSSEWRVTTRMVTRTQAGKGGTAFRLGRDVMAGLILCWLRLQGAMIVVAFVGPAVRAGVVENPLPGGTWALFRDVLCMPLGILFQSLGIVCSAVGFRASQASCGLLHFAFVLCSETEIWPVFFAAQFDACVSLFGDRGCNLFQLANDGTC